MTEKQNRNSEGSEKRVLNLDLGGVQKASRTDEAKNDKEIEAGEGLRVGRRGSAGAPGEKKAKRQGVKKRGGEERASKKTKKQASPKAEAGKTAVVEEVQAQGAGTEEAVRDAGGRFVSRHGEAGGAKAAGGQAKGRGHGGDGSGDDARDNLRTEAGQRKLVDKLLGKANAQTFKLSAGDLIRLIQLQKELMVNAPRTVTVQWVEDERE